MLINIANRRKIVLNNQETQIYVGRPSVLANPFRMKDATDRVHVIKQYREYIENLVFNEQLQRFHKITQELILQELDRIYKLLTKHNELTLICWCSPLKCHAEIITKVINKLYKTEIEIKYI
jgi:hypothetical protein